MSGGIALAANRCSDGTCSTRERLRRYYLTSSVFAASLADSPSTCEVGFHFASVWEILDTSQVEYDPTLGYNDPDPGEIGPGNATGWIRGGPADCSNWAGGGPLISGSTARLDSGLSDAAIVISPWEIINQTCVAPSRVFCVED